MPRNPIQKAGAFIAGRMTKGGKIFVRSLNPLESLQQYFEFRKVEEGQKTERERIIAQRDIAVCAIEAERDTILEYFKLRFAERREALGGFFQVLGRAVEEKNDKLMDIALAGILGVLRESPLKDFEAFRESRVRGEIIEI